MPIDLSVGTLDLGDLNQDGEINIVDIVLLVGIIIEPDNPPSNVEFTAGDYNQDGEINVVERMKLLDSNIGGEGNGGVILKESHLGRDSLVGTIMILNLLVRENKSLNKIYRLYRVGQVNVYLEKM